MRARARSCLAAALLACGAAAAVPVGCSGTKGQMMFVFKTDMSLPKDIDAIRVLITLAGAVVYDETFQRLGTDEGIRLPATLGFYTPDDPTQALHLRLIATQGGEENVRLMGEVVTTVPEDRTAVLDVPVQLLCYGRDEVERDEQGAIRRDDLGSPRSRCGEGRTCVAGNCAPREIQSVDLPDYIEAQVFGGGSGDGDGLCFDTTRCFEGEEHVPIQLDLDAFDPDVRDTCWAVADEAAPDLEGVQRILAAGEINLALLTQGGGICSESECYTPLDAESDVGWRTAAEGRIRLPDAVCAKALTGELRGVAAVRSGGGTCQRKGSSLPTCGPWSASGGDQYTVPDGEVSTPLALGLAHPVAIAVTDSGVYWTETGTFEEVDGRIQPRHGAVKWVPLGGGNPLVLADELSAPRDLAVRPLEVRPRENAPGQQEVRPELVFWTMPGAGVADGEIRIVEPERGEKGGLTLPFPMLGRPQGIALTRDTLYWTEESTGGVFQATLTDEWLGTEDAGLGTAGAGLDTVVGPATPLTGAGVGGEPGFESPYRVAVAGDVVCWVYQGQLEPRTAGAVACQPPGGGAVQVVAADQVLPRALTLDGETPGNLQLYWATYDADGAIFSVDLGGLGGAEPVDFAPVRVATGQAYPSGIAADAEHIYWTSQLDGTVLRARKPRTPGEVVEIEPLARDQRRPGAIAVHRDALYWINEGSPGPLERDGAVMRLTLRPER
ncbi:hypothetical protein [Sorangium sp. So ce131]|uniref:hypothetical protein n=1 Tax=Sorangium sp. So ce131 TaxID=3133282 RepID=UPI003F61E739